MPPPNAYPLPANYLIGIDVQQRDFEDFSRPSYLRGEYRDKGWWYYYAYAILVKAPLGTLGLIGVALGSTFVFAMLRWALSRGRRRVDEGGPRLAPSAHEDGERGIPVRDLVILLAPAVIIFAVASSKSGFSHHSRYVLPCVPFVFIWVSGLGRHIDTLVTTMRAVWRRSRVMSSIGPERCASSLIGMITICLLAWSVISSLIVYPHSMSYFNELAGGPKNGPEHLLNSNIDWGQDLLFLERWIDAQKDLEQPVFLAFDNYYNPFNLDIQRIKRWPFGRDQETGTPVSVPDGVYAISVNQLYEFPWPIRDREGSLCQMDRHPLAFLRQAEPIGWAGYSIRLYSAEQMRQAYASPPGDLLWNPSDSQ